MDAYLDTTILVDVLLNVGAKREASKTALKKYKKTILPVYAIKELKAGALSNFIWFHNKVAQFPLQRALQALQQSALSPKRYQTATAIQALTTSLTSAPVSISDLEKKYGAAARLDEVVRDRVRLGLKRQIKRAWRQRRAVTNEVIGELSCYTGEGLLTESANGILDKGSTTCPVSDCCLAKPLKADDPSLKKLSAALTNCPAKPETTKRKAVIDQLIDKKKEPLTPKQCRNLGDAYFAYFAPGGATILTTNKADHEPLAVALGKTVETP